MRVSTGRGCAARGIFLLVLLAGFVVVPAVTAAGDGNRSMQVTPGPDFNTSNHSFTDGRNAGEFAAAPTPVTVFRADLDESTLPGPRYMAFGPSTIGLFVDPRMLAVIAAIVFAGLAIGFVVVRRLMAGEDGAGGKKE
jgi:hypothetical protein